MSGAPPDEGGELEDADVERVAGTEQRAPVGDLLGGGVGDAGRGGAQRPLHGRAVEDLDLVGLGLLGERHLRRGPAVGGERARAAGPADHEIAGLARRAPRLLDMADRERPQADALGREAQRPVRPVADRLRRRADPPVGLQPERRLGDRQRRQRLVEHHDPGAGRRRRCPWRPRCRAGRAAAARAGSAPARSARRRRTAAPPRRRAPPRPPARWRRRRARRR